MAYDPHFNLGYATIGVAPSPATSGTTIGIANSLADRFPDPGSVGEYNVTIWAPNTLPTPVNSEIVRFTAKGAVDSAGTGYTQYTIERLTEQDASGSMTARTIVVGDWVIASITKKTIEDIETNKQETSEKGQANGYASLDGSGKVPTAQLPSFVNGPSSATDDAIPVFDGTTGKLIAESAFKIQSNKITINESFLIETEAVQGGIILQPFHGGDVQLAGGGAFTGVDAGNVVLAAQSDYSYGQARGYVKITSGQNTSYGIAIDTEDITAERVVTFPDKAGTVAFLDDVVGDVVGPASSTDNAVVRFDSTTGKLIQNSTVIIGDTGNISGVGNVALDGSTIRDITVGRSSSGQGNSLTVKAGGGESGASNMGGGSLILSSGISTGNSSSNIVMYVYGGGSSGTADGTPLQLMTITDTGFFLRQTGTVPSATGGNGTFYVKSSDEKAYFKSASGTEYDLTKQGDVVGPGSATDNALVRFDSTTGKLVQNSGVTIDDSNNIAGLGTVSSGAITSTGASSLGSLTLSTDLAVSEGGTGASSASAARTNLGVQSKVFYTVGSTDADYITDGTADDVEIQAAIDAANSAGGGIVHLKENTYNIAATILIKDNTILEGEGWTTIIKLTNATRVDMIENSDQVGGNTNIVIRDLKLDGNKANQASGVSLEGIDFVLVSNFLIHNVWIIDVGTTDAADTAIGCSLAGACTEGRVISCRAESNNHYGFNNNNCSNISYVNNLSISNGRHGFGSANGSSHITWTGNVLKNNTQQGFWTRNTSNSTISGNTIQMPSASLYGIQIKKDSGDTNQVGDQFNTVTGNTISGACDYGIYIQNHATYCTVTGNTINGCDEYGINHTASEYNMLSNNFIYNCDLDGIRVDGTAVTIQGNYVHTCGNNGIYVDANESIVNNNNCQNNSIASSGAYNGITIADCLRVVVSGNRCWDNQGTKTQGYGIVESGTTNYSVITSNILLNNLTGAYTVIGANTEVGHNITA
jgi:parallel beta-helix repeat protein